ncbi:Protein kinase domain family protein [Acanthocheilonema viteae]|uniref:PRKR-like endoplasmic reticulum kinase n=1 Tax=Acanthocheilonema viteae TaxID=6277 RepID=A0A498SHX3_ACAVI|nr:unnamed protein product [Acanthocheilonema viteae]
MRRVIALLITGTLILLFAVFFRTSLTHDDEVAFVEDDVEEMELLPEQASVECCDTGSASFISKHYLLVSTIDGKITAMDIEKNGEVVWTVDADKVPLLSSSLNQQKLVAENFPYMLVPSLDGSLYMFNVKSSSLSLIPLSADARIMIGNDEVAGGTFVTSTGIDPLTGKIRYRCTAGRCMQYEITTNDSSLYTLIVRKNTQIARAADPVTGIERWNLSVGEYDISLVSSDDLLRFEVPSIPAHIHFLLEPPSGSVSAVDNCGNLKWEKRLSSPVARAWQLSRGKILEISLFSSETIGALSDFSGSDHQFIPKYEAPFYFGTVNSEPYIIPSEYMRELHRTSADMGKEYHPQTLDSFYHSRAPFLEDLKVGDLIRRSYRTTRNAAEANQVNSVRDSAASKSLTCNIYDAVTIAGSKKLKENIEAKGDHGWYIFKPLRKPCQKKNLFREIDQKKRRSSYNFPCRRRNVLEGLKQIAYEPVSGWWKIIALLLSLIASSFAAIIIFYWQQIRHLKLFVLLHDLGKRSHNHSNLSLPSLQKIKYMNVGASVGTRMSRKRSTTTSHSAQESFSSKFLEDFVPEKWLGRGGYGVVFNCRNRLDDRSYAVKRIAVSNTTAAIDHVKREARAMARLDHPGIIRYFHTWMEKPPSGWQQAKDKEILQNIRFIEDSGNKSIIQTLENDQNTTQSKILAIKDSSLSEELFHGVNLNTSANEKGISASDDTDNLSWMDDNNDSKLGGATESDSSSDSNSEPIGHGITAIATGNDDSTDIIFADCGNSLRSTEEIAGKRSRSSKLLDPLEPPAVLVRSMCDLQSCKNIKDYVYLYIQMELCQELTLHSWLLANNRDEHRKITRMRKWFAELVCAIDYIHNQGLIHRDLKPQNIFFSANNYLKIGDLGLVTNYVNAEERSDFKQDVITNISHTSYVGTRLYMSPEQLKGKPYNEKVDVFSLGLIYVELIVPITTIMERNSILSGLQNGIMPKCLDNLPPKEKNFVAWLTVVDPELRPSARQLAECDYLQDEVNMLGTSYFRKHTFLGSR